MWSQYENRMNDNSNVKKKLNTNIRANFT